MDGFWVFMLICSLLIPLTMIVFGRLFQTRAPRDINFVFGYRTEMSVKNRDTWEFAHRYCGRLWLTVGLIMLPVSAVVMLLVLGRGEDTTGYVGAALSLAQIMVLVGTIVPVERALKRNFDSRGRRRGQ